MIPAATFKHTEATRASLGEEYEKCTSTNKNPVRGGEQALFHVAHSEWD